MIKWCNHKEIKIGTAMTLPKIYITPLNTPNDADGKSIYNYNMHRLQIFRGLMWHYLNLLRTKLRVYEIHYFPYVTRVLFDQFFWKHFLDYFIK